MNLFDIFVKIASLSLFFSASIYAQEDNGTNIQLIIKQENENSLNILTFELTNSSQEVFRTTAVGVQKNYIILKDIEGEEVEDNIWIRAKEYYIPPGKTMKWQVDIDFKLDAYSFKGFQYPGSYIIKWKIVFWDKQKNKQTIYSKPITYEKTTNPDIVYKIRLQEASKKSLTFSIANSGNGDTILISNQYRIFITDAKKQSVIYFSKEKPKDIFLLQSRYHRWTYKNMNEIIESYESEGLEQSGEYFIQWKLDCSNPQKNRNYEAESPIFTYIKTSK